jgi:two-component system, OmpR family, sensor kinase
MALQVFMAVAAVAAMLLGAANCERRRALEAMALNRQRAQEAVQARDEFLSIASHELRTPLSALMLQLASLQKRAQEGAPVIDDLPAKIGRAVKTTDRLATLVESLFDVSRIANGRMDLQVETCDLTEIAREVVERATPEARRAGCELRLRADGATPGQWDRLRVVQILSNLLGNAIKYGAGKPIEVVVDATADAVQLSVRDDGIGIGEADLDRIFGRFERAVPARHYGGLGLGLYIARQIAEAHGGRLGVYSQPGAGATFTMTLPRATPS